jgi:hypothetical protein
MTIKQHQSYIRHCERSEAISPLLRRLPRSIRPRNDRKIKRSLLVSLDLGLRIFCRQAEPEYRAFFAAVHVNTAAV